MSSTAVEFLLSSLIAAGVTVVALCIFVGIYWIFRGFPPASRMVVEEVQEIGIPNDKATLLFFYTKWCPYSKEAMPAIHSLETIIKERTYGGKTVTVEHINCESDTKCSEHKVDSYPSYKLKTSSKTFEYLGPPKTTVLREFLVDALGPELEVSTPSNSD